MTRLRPVLAACALFAASALAQPPAQPEPKGAAAPVTPLPLAAAVLDYAGDDTLTAELTLTPEQVRKLTDHRQKAWDERYTTVPAEFAKGAADRARAAEAVVKETLSPAQLDRAKQLVARRLVGPVPPARGGPAPAAGTITLSGRTLAQYPELADVLKLTAEQKAQLAPRTTAARTTYPTLTLDQDQAAAVEKALGPAPAKPLVAAADPRMNRPLQVPPELRLLVIGDVQLELKLTGEQSRTVDRMFSRWTAAYLSGNAVSPRERYERVDAAAAEVAAFVGALKPEQVARLGQVGSQQAVVGRPLPARYQLPEVEKALALTDQQKAALAGIAADWEAEVVKAFDAAEPSEATARRLDAAAMLFETRATAVLTPDQAARFHALVGPPYTGRYTDFRPPAPEPGPVPFKGSAATRAHQEASFGLYLTDLSHLARNPDVQADLKMTPEQVRKAQAALAQLNVAHPAARPTADPAALTRSYADRSAATETALAEVLTPGQRERFRQVMLQIAEARNGPTVYQVPSAVAYPGVADAVKLTAGQRAKLLAGADPAEVLTADQKAAIRAMLGDQYRGRVTPTTIGPVNTPAPAAGPSRVRQLTTGRFDAVLKITPEQKAKIAAAYASYEDAARPLLTPGFGTPATDIDARIKAAAALSEKFDRELAAILTPEQQKRLAQVGLQAAAAACLSAALELPDTAKALGLSADQLQQIDAVAADADRVAGLLAAQNLGAEKTNPLAERLRDRTDDRLLAVLTDGQRATWKELTGEPAGFRKTPLGPFRGGLGGGGGGPGPKQ